MLYLFNSKQVETVRETAGILGKGEANIHRWLAQYREGGIENLLKNRQTIGRPKKLSVETASKIQRELKEPEGFASYKEIDFWLRVVQGVSSSYGTVYHLVKLVYPTKNGYKKKLRGNYCLRSLLLFTFIYFSSGRRI